MWIDQDAIARYDTILDMASVVDQLISRYRLVSDQVDQAELMVILTELERVILAYPTGSVVELGCYAGTTSLFIRRLLDHYASTLDFHVYDSFAGLPDKSDEDSSAVGDAFRAGELSVSRKQFEQNFHRAGLRLPHVHRAWFSDLSSEDIPSDIVFAFLDGDFYQSIKDSLHLITPKLSPGAVIVVDDYANESLPGAARAVDEWLRPRNQSLRVQSSLAIIRYIS